MNQPGLDGRHRDINGRISAKHGNTLNMHLSPPILGFSPLATLRHMRTVTGKFSEADVRRTARLMQLLRGRTFTIAQVKAAAERARAKRELEQRSSVPALLAALRRLRAQREQNS